MTITLITAGSRGDIQPFVALGVRLQREGRQVRLCAPTIFQSFIESNGLPFSPMNDEFLSLTDATESGGKSMALINKAKPLIRKMLDDAWNAAQGSSLILYHPKILGAPYMADALRIPAVMVMALPAYTPTRAYPNPILPPTLKLGGMFNRLSYSVINLVKAPFIGVLNDWRRAALDLPPVGMFSDDLKRADGSRTPVFYAYSPRVIPRPADYPPEVHVTGYWFLDTPRWTPPADLQDFLNAGDPPVYIGFGSMMKRDPAAMTRTVLEAAAKSGVRAILATGWGALKASEVTSHVYIMESAPHDWLFPRLSAVVHHGGAGTTAAALRAGVPSVITPFIADQPFWGWRVHQLGAGAAPIPQAKLTAENLAAAIREVTTAPAIRRCAEQIGEAIRAEDGVGEASRLIATMLH